MTDVVSVPTEDLGARDRASDVGIDEPAAPAWLDLCPYLRDASGEWRAIAATTDHRCTAVAPPAPVTLQTQRSLCLVAAHVDCPVYRDAREGRAGAAGSVRPSRPARPIPLNVPVILERPTGAALLAARVRDSLPQVGLVVLIALAIAAVVLARVIAP
jgi:hypothetical protein